MNTDSDSQRLLNIVRRDAVSHSGPDDPASFVELVEPKNPGSQFRISNIPHDLIVLQSDRFPAPETFFVKGLCNRADFILFSESARCAIFFELKGATDSKDHILRQLCGAECVFEYGRRFGRFHWHDPDFLHDVEKHYVVACQTHMDKRPMHRHAFSTTGTGTTLESPLILHFHKSVQFSKLLGRG